MFDQPIRVEAAFRGVKPWRMAALYLALGLLWIIGSDQALQLFIQNGEALTVAQTFKGWAFVIVTALLFLAVAAGLTSDRGLVQKELERSRREFLRLADLASEGIWLLNEQGETTFVNSRLATMLGTTPERLCEVGVEAFLEEPWRAPTAASRRERVERVEARYEVRFRREDDSEMWALVNASPIIEPDGSFGGALRMMTDLTDLKRSHQQIIGAYESQRHLLNELNHRVRNNLASLISLIDLSRGRAGDVDGFAEVLRGRVFALSQAHAVITQTRKTPVVLEEIVRSLMGASEQARIGFEGPETFIEPGRISSLAIVFQELIANSRKYGALADEQGRIEVSWEVAPKDDVPRLRLTWDEFHQRIPPSGDGNGHANGHGNGNGSRRAESRLMSGGAGLQLIEGIVRYDLQGQAKAGREPHGFRCEIDMRLPQPTATESAAV